MKPSNHLDPTYIPPSAPPTPRDNEEEDNNTMKYTNSHKKPSIPQSTSSSASAGSTPPGFANKLQQRNTTANPAEAPSSSTTLLATNNKNNLNSSNKQSSPTSKTQSSPSLAPDDRKNTLTPNDQRSVPLLNVNENNNKKDQNDKLESSPSSLNLNRKNTSINATADEDEDEDELVASDEIKMCLANHEQEVREERERRAKISKGLSPSVSFEFQTAQKQKSVNSEKKNDQQQKQQPSPQEQRFAATANITSTDQTKQQQQHQQNQKQQQPSVQRHHFHHQYHHSSTSSGGGGEGGPPPTIYHSSTNPRTLIPWNHRVPGDRSAVNSFANFCGFCLAPHFWSRVESALRHTLLAWLPIIMMLRNNEWRANFFIAFTLPLMTVFVGGNEFGESMTGLVTLIKSLVGGVLVSMPFLAAGPVDESNPGVWIGYWVGFFLAIFIITHLTWKTWASRFIVFIFSTFVVEHWFIPVDDYLVYYPKYLRDVGIGVIIALGPCFLPWPRFAMKKVQVFLPTMGNSISILVQGVVASAWTANTVEQRLDLVRLRQIRKHLRVEEGRITRALNLAWYEPFSNLTIARATKRFELLKKLSIQMSSFVRLVDQIANQRTDILTADSTFVKFGELLKDDLKIVLEVFDATLLRLCDCDNYITQEELDEFRQAEHTFMVALIRARSRIYYGENFATYKLGDVDLYFAHFFFFLDEIFDRVSKFEDVREEDVPSRLMDILIAIKDNITIPFSRLIRLPWFYWNEDDLMSVKHSIKLSVSMTIAAFLGYPIAVNPVAPGIVALAHFSDSSFQYGLQFLIGTLWGGLASFIAVKIAAGSYVLEVVFFEFIICFAQFVWTSENWISAAIAIILATAGVLSDPSSTAAGLVNQLASFAAAIMCHLVVYTFLLWPQDPIRNLKQSIDDSISTFRDGVCTLLFSVQPRHMDQESCRELTTSTRFKLAGVVATQRMLLPAANAEPTMIGSDFPLPLYYRLINAQDQMVDLLHNMSISFERFLSPLDAPEGKKTLHWVTVATVAEPCHELAELVSGFVDLVRLMLTEGTGAVPISELVRLSDEMKSLSKRIYNLRNDKINSIRQKKYKRVCAIREIRFSRSQSSIQSAARPSAKSPSSPTPPSNAESGTTSPAAVVSMNDLEALADAIMKAKGDAALMEKYDDAEAEKRLADEQADFESSDEGRESGDSNSDDQFHINNNNDDDENGSQDYYYDKNNKSQNGAASAGSVGARVVQSQPDSDDERADIELGRHSNPTTPANERVDSSSSSFPAVNNNNNNNNRQTAYRRHHSSATANRRRASSSSPVGSPPSANTRLKKKKIDPLLGVDMDSVSAHALSTFIVATEAVSRILDEFLEAHIDILNSDEISKMTM